VLIKINSKGKKQKQRKKRKIGDQSDKDGKVFDK
jgi:hypothetical protein